MNFNDDDQAAFEEELQQTDATAVLVGIHSELTQIRRLLEQADDAGGDGGAEQWTCGMCGETMPKTELQAHAEKEHNAPKDMPLDQLGRANK